MLQPAVLDPNRLEGDYAFYDDGWPCQLTIRRQAKGGLSARFFSYARTEGAFSARLSLDHALSNRVEIVVSNFNEMARQVYTGYVFTRAISGIAGTTEVKGEPYGFFARRQPPYSIGSLLPGAARPIDFLGSYSLYCDGEHATLDLMHLDGMTLHGAVSEDDGGAVFPVIASIDPIVPHQVEIMVRDVPAGSGGSPTMALWMFSRPRTALAGWMRWGEARLGCYLTRFSWSVSAR